MAKDNSFDVVSQVDMQEMDNAVNQTKKEIGQRFDFRGSSASIELEEKCLKITGEDDYKLSAILDVLRQRMAKRNIPLKCLKPGKIEPASKGTVKQTIDIEQGISKEKARDIIAAIVVRNGFGFDDTQVSTRMRLGQAHSASPFTVVHFL